MIRGLYSGQVPRQVGETVFWLAEAVARGLALPTDLGRSLRLLNDNGLDRLMKAVIEEVRRRGRTAPDGPSVAGRSARPTPAKTARAKPSEPDNAAAVTSGQQRLILAAYEAGLKPASIAKEFRVSRATVQSVITGAQCDRRNMER